MEEVQECASGEGFLNDGYWFVNHVGDADHGAPALACLSRRWPHRDWPALFAAGHVQCRNVKLAPDTPLRRGAELRVWRAPWREPAPTQGPLEVVYESSELLVVVKPHGIPVVPHGNFLQSALVARVRALGHPDAAPLHRLGRGTTGAIVFGKTPAAASKWCRSFADRSVKVMCKDDHAAALTLLCRKCTVVWWREYPNGMRWMLCVILLQPLSTAAATLCLPLWIPAWRVPKVSVLERTCESQLAFTTEARTRFTVVKRGPSWAVLDADIATGRPVRAVCKSAPVDSIAPSPSLAASNSVRDGRSS